MDSEHRMGYGLRSKRLISAESDKAGPANKLQESVPNTPIKKTPGRRRSVTPSLEKQNELSTPSKSETPRRMTRRNSLVGESSPAIVSTPTKLGRGRSLAVIEEIKDVNSGISAGMIRNCYVLLKKNLNIYNERGYVPDDALRTLKDKNKIVKKLSINIKKSPKSLVDNSKNSHEDSSNKVEKRGRKKNIKNVEVNDSVKNISNKSDAISVQKSSPYKNQTSLSNSENTENVDNTSSIESIIKESEKLSDLDHTKNKSYFEDNFIENSEKNRSKSIEKNDDLKEITLSKLCDESEEHKVTFEESVIENQNSPMKYVKTPYLSKTKSILDDNISAINASLKDLNAEEESIDVAKIKNADYSITENPNNHKKSSKQQVDYNKISPFKYLKRNTSLPPTSTPVNSIQLKAKPNSIDYKKVKDQERFSWVQSKHGKAGEKLDIIDINKKKVESPIKPSLKNKSQSFVDVYSSESEESDNEEKHDKNEFIDDEALVNENDSLDEKERQYIEDNQVPIDAISLGSQDSDMNNTSEEYENDSFVVSSEEVELHSVSEDDDGMENSKDTKDSKKYNRIMQQSSDSETSNTGKESAHSNNKDSVSISENEFVKNNKKPDSAKKRHSIYFSDIPNKSPGEKANITIIAPSEEENDPLNTSKANKNNDTHFIDPNNMTIFEEKNIEESDPLLNTTTINNNNENKILKETKDKIELETENLSTILPKTKYNRKSVDLVDNESEIENLVEGDLSEERKLKLNTSSKERQSPKKVKRKSMEKLYGAENNCNEYKDDNDKNVSNSANTTGKTPSKEKQSPKKIKRKSVEKLFDAENNCKEYQDDNDKNLSNNVNSSVNRSKERLRTKSSERKQTTIMHSKLDQTLSPQHSVNKTIHYDSEDEDCNSSTKEKNVSGTADSSLNKSKERKSNKIEMDNYEKLSPQQDKRISLDNILADVVKNYNEFEDEDYNPSADGENSSGSADSSLNKSKEKANVNNDNKEWETIMQISDVSPKNSDEEYVENLSESIKINKERVKQLAKGFCDNAGWANIEKNHSPDLDQSQNNSKVNQSNKQNDNVITTNDLVEKLGSDNDNNLNDSADTDDNEKENENLKPDTELTMQNILSRCDAILEKAQQDKKEAKLNAKKNKVTTKKKTKKSKTETVSKNVEVFEKKIKISNDEPSTSNLISSEMPKKILHVKSKLLSSDILNTITEYTKNEGNLIKINKKRKYSDEHDGDESQSTKRNKKMKVHDEMVQLESLPSSNANMKNVRKRKMSNEPVPDSPAKSSSKGKITKYASGEFYEEPLTPERKIKGRNIISKFKTNVGLVIEEPLTPTKVQNGFIESALTPKPIGYKVRKLLCAGQQELPPILKSNEEKRSRYKINISEPISQLPKPVWTKSGLFYENKLTSNVLQAIPIEVKQLCSTEFGICSLKSKKSKTSCDLNSKAMEFKTKSKKNEKNIRESSKDLLRRKARQNVFKKF